jgi:hypothetical protein
MLNLAGARIGAETVIAEKQFDALAPFYFSMGKEKTSFLFSGFLASLHLHLHLCRVRESFHVLEAPELLQANVLCMRSPLQGLQAVRSSVSQ